MTSRIELLELFMEVSCFQAFMLIQVSACLIQVTEFFLFFFLKMIHFYPELNYHQKVVMKY